MDYRLMPVLLVIFLDGCWRCCDDPNVHPRPSLCRSSTGPPRLINPKRHLEVSKQVYIRLFLFSKLDQTRSQYDIVWPKIWWSKLALLVTFDHGHPPTPQPDSPVRWCNTIETAECWWRLSKVQIPLNPHWFGVGFYRSSGNFVLFKHDQIWNTGKDVEE
jgi:hypothetical protein